MCFVFFTQQKPNEFCIRHFFFMVSPPLSPSNASTEDAIDNSRRKSYKQKMIKQCLRFTILQTYRDHYAVQDPAYQYTSRDPDPIPKIYNKLRKSVHN